MSAGIALLVALGIAAATCLWSARAVQHAGQLALAGTLAAVATAFNVVVPIPNVELTTTVVLCTAAVLGVRSAAVVAAVSTLATGTIAGLGPWTPWQVLAALALAIAAAAVTNDGQPPTVQARRLAFVAALGVPAHDAVVTIGSLSSVSATTGVTVPAVLAAGLPFTVLHASWCAVATWFAGPPLLRALHRARTRFDDAAAARVSVR